MKRYVRTLWGDDKELWANETMRDNLKQYLNELGFYVLSGIGNSLDVYVIEESEPLDVKIAKKTLDKIKKLWYSSKTRGVSI